MAVAWMVAGPSTLWAQEAAPAAVIGSAVDAVEELGRQVVLGNHRAAIDHMYPQWKERMAKRKGGVEALEKELDGIGETLARNGVSIISFRTEGRPTLHEVWPGQGPDGQATFEKWLVLIPTVTEFRIMHGEQPRGQVVKSHGFQVAIANKDEMKWGFINGSDVSVSDLRALFITLPPELELPQVWREAGE